MYLPSLDNGITHLEVTGSRSVPALQAIVLDHLLLHEGPAFWADAMGHATTAALARVAPSWRLLERIHVARGFTPYQHHTLIADLSARINETLREDPSAKPTLIIAPAIDAQYRDADTLSEAQGETLLARSLARLQQYADGYDVPVLVTTTEDGTLTETVRRAAAHELRCEETRLGPRFVGDEFETLVYPAGDGYYQTTIAYWTQILGARAEQAGLEPSAGAVQSDGPRVGTGISIEGTATPTSASPLLDAWAGGR
nr:hypothetical protein [Halobellus ruber]